MPSQRACQEGDLGGHPHGNEQRHPNENKQRLLPRCWPEQGVGHCRLCLAEAGKQAEECKDPQRNREEAPGLPGWRPSAWGLEEGVPCVWSGGMSGSPVGPKLEGRTDIKEGGSYESSPGHSGPMLQGLSFDFLGWLLPVKGIIYVYVQCLSLEETESWLPAASPQGLAGTVGVLARPRGRRHLTLLLTLIPGSCPAWRPS